MLNKCFQKQPQQISSLHDCCHVKTEDLQNKPDQKNHKTFHSLEFFLPFFYRFVFRFLIVNRQNHIKTAGKLQSFQILHFILFRVISPVCYFW